MPDNNYKYIWRCAKCSYHFANVINLGGSLKQEKKCPKCKSINTLTLTDKEILLQCKYAEKEEEIPDSYQYQ
ncbi:MAG: hypothetical protein ABIG10_00005 [bacterium]